MMTREYSKFGLVFLGFFLFGIPPLLISLMFVNSLSSLVVAGFGLTVTGIFWIAFILLVRDERREKQEKLRKLEEYKDMYVPEEDFKGLDKLTDELPFCACGDPGGQLRLLRELLKLGNYIENEQAINQLFKDNPERVYEMFFGVMDHVGLLTHGISIRGAFLTTKGKAFLQTTDADIEKWEEQFDE